MSNGVGSKLFGLMKVLAIGPFFAQFLILAASPVLTRLYSPKDFAAIAVYLLVGTAIASVACLKLDNAVIRSTSSFGSARIAMVAMIAAFLVSIFVLIVVICTVFLFDFSEYQCLALLLPLYIFIGALYDILNALGLRRYCAQLVTKGRIVLAVSSLVLQVTFGFFELGATGFVFGVVFGYLCSVIYLYIALRVNFLRWFDNIMSDIESVFKNNRHDLIYGGPSALFLTMQNNFPVVIFTFIAGSTVGGFYALIQRVVFNPVIIVVGVIGQSVLPWVCRTRDQDSKAFLFKISSMVAVSVLGLVLGIYPFTESIFAFVFGEQWRQAGVYAGLLLLLLPYRILYEILSVLLIAESRQGVLFVTRGLAFLTGILVLFISDHSDLRDLFLWFSFAQAICGLFGVFAISYFLKVALTKLLAKMSFGLLISFLVVLYESKIIIHVGENTLDLLFGTVGALIFLLSLITVYSARDQFRGA